MRDIQKPRGMRRNGNIMSNGCKVDQPWFSLFTSPIISGAEGDNEGAADGTEGNGSEGEGGDADDASRGSEGHDSSQDEGKDLTGLKSALAEERKERKRLEREARALQKDKTDRELAEKSDLEQATARLEASEARATKLASGYLRSNLDAAIRAAAKDFVDPTDAIDGVDRSKLTFKQDKDDPTDIEIDIKSIETEVKRLATRKPHFVKKGTDDGDATGSQFGGSKQKPKTSEDALKAKYPSL